MRTETTFTPATKRTEIAQETKLMPISTAQLLSSQPYQRPLDKAFIAEKVSNFNPNKVNVVRVSYRDGKYNVIDGQHTVAIIRGHNGNKDTQVLCKVVYGLTLEEEAKLYNEQYSDTHKLTSADKWLGEKVAKNPNVLACIAATAKAGVELGIEPSKRGKAINRIVALESAGKAYNKLGERYYTKTIALLRNTYNGDSQAFSKQMLDGMADFMSLYGKDIDEITFINKLRKVSPEEIVRKSKSDQITRNNSMKVAKVLYSTYNYRQTKNRLVSKFEY